ncbi:MAG: GNAT family N-acetyltransferase [Anaerolineae bacterium]|nr:GNAT family N-acetyltransferase [Anaerolineae bacterium]
MLKGERVLLRGVRRDDLIRLWEFNNDPEVEIAGGGDPPIPQSLERLEAEFDENARKGGRDGALFAIEADGRMIGVCGLHGFDHFRGVAHRCELGITIGDKDYWGKGYGREAITLLVDYAFTHWNVQRVGLQVLATNERAIRAYQAVGFVQEGRLRRYMWSNGSYVDGVSMSILREEWQARKTTELEVQQAVQDAVSHLNETEEKTDPQEPRP